MSSKKLRRTSRSDDINTNEANQEGHTLHIHGRKPTNMQPIEYGRARNVWAVLGGLLLHWMARLRTFFSRMLDTIGNHSAFVVTANGVSRIGKHRSLRAAPKIALETLSFWFCWMSKEHAPSTELDELIINELSKTNQLVHF